MTDHRPTDPDAATHDTEDDRADRADRETGHTTDKAELGQRDLPQENLATEQANLRAGEAGDDGANDEAEREEALDELHEDRTG